MVDNPPSDSSPPGAAPAATPGPADRARRLRAAGSWASACVAALLLVGMAVDGRARSGGADVEAHHEAVRRVAATSVAYSFGDWVGRDVEASRGALEVLRPNAILRRDYENFSTGECASLLLVQCSDARDLIGHYPPVCYPSHGLTAGPAVAKDWVVGDVRIRAMRYRFDTAGPTGGPSIFVDNFMVLPGRGTGRDMDSVRDLAGDPRRRRLGAAQFQVVTDGTMGDERRDRVFEEIVEPNLPLLRVLGATAGTVEGAETRESGAFAVTGEGSRP